MFDYINIEGFRSFKKVELNLGPLSVLIGPNNGGKSNFLDFLSFMAEAAAGKLEAGFNSRGGTGSIGFGFDWLRGKIVVELRFRGESLAFGSEGWILLEGDQPGVRFKLKLDLDIISSEVESEELIEEPTSDRPRPATIVRRDRTECIFRPSKATEGQEPEERKVLQSKAELAIFQVKDLNKFPVPYVLLDQFQKWAFYDDMHTGADAAIRRPGLVRPTFRLSGGGENLASVLNSIQQQKPDTWSEILEILHTAYPDFKTITFPPEGGDGKVVLRWWERPHEREGVSANFLSDGTLKFLCLIAILKSPDPPPLICIDEPELGLHPDWIKLVAELLQDAATRTQVIVATHSPYIVAKLEPEQVIVTEKIDGATHLRQLKTADLENFLKDFSLADLWLSGEIGGRP
jgi:predicted ATPase